MLGEPSGYWGKLKRGEDGTVAEWLALEDHMIDVAACFERLLSTGHADVLATAAGIETLDGNQRARLAVLAAIHDLGKLNVGFQGRSDASFDASSKRAGHVTEAVSLLIGPNRDVFVEAFGLLDLAEWFSSPGEDAGTSLCRMLLCSWSHHGKPAEATLHTISSGARSDRSLRAVRWDGDGHVDLRAACARIRELMEDTWPEAFEAAAPIPLTPALMDAFNGLLTLADWMGSDDRVFEYDAGPAYNSRKPFATERAEGMVLAMGIDFHAGTVVAADRVFGFELNPMQALLASSGRSLS